MKFFKTFVGILGALAFLAPSLAMADERVIVRVVTDCNSVTLTAGLDGYLYVGPDGKLCVNIATSPAANLATGQVSIGTTATLLVASRTGRHDVTIENEGTVDIHLGGSNVTTSTGILLPGTKGASITLSNFSGSLYGIVATGTQTVDTAETY